MLTPRSALLALLRIYKRLFSPELQSSCRFAPTCSDYSAEAIARHGAFIGSLLTLYRIVRCSPFFPGGLDVVPLRLTCHPERSEGSPSLCDEMATPTSVTTTRNRVAVPLLTTEKRRSTTAPPKEVSIARI